MDQEEKEVELRTLGMERLQKLIGESERLQKLTREPGDSVSEGDILCVIEAMKLFNEIESEFSGKIVKVLVEDASPVEFDQPLFLIDPS